MAASGGSFSSAVGPPRLTYPGSGSGEPAELAALPSEEAEADVLPFALDADAVPASPHPPVPLRMSLGGTPSPPGALSRRAPSPFCFWMAPKEVQHGHHLLNQLLCLCEYYNVSALLIKAHGQVLISVCIIQETRNNTHVVRHKPLGSRAALQKSERSRILWSRQNWTRRWARLCARSRRRRRRWRARPRPWQRMSSCSTAARPPASPCRPAWTSCPASRPAWRPCEACSLST